MMNLLIFGSTGTIGRHLVQQALSAGHQVNAFARNPQKLEDLKHPNLRFLKGDVLDGTAVEKALPGHDAVLCALGAGRKGQVRAEGTRNILRAMEKSGVNRLICQTTLGAGDSRGNLNFFWKHLMFGFLLKDAYQDHELQEKYIRESPLNWIIVRPSAFTDGKLTSNYRHGFAPTDKSINPKISRADVADFMLKQLADDTYLRKTPGLSY
ncbi:MAG: SDR family oxidoreductase [Cyclobacteriaceae bacterium]|jgi:putative NADH-flavin reductase